MKEILKGILIGFLAGTLLAYLLVSLHEETKVHYKETAQPSHQVTSQSTLKVTQKTTEGDPDLIVSNRYVAKIDGVEVEAPVSSRKDTNTAQITTTIDVTPLVTKMTPRWEAGVGISYIEDKKIMPCVSVQRNYEYNKAIEMTAHMDTKGHLEGVSLVHKWRF